MQKPEGFASYLRNAVAVAVGAHEGLNAESLFGNSHRTDVIFLQNITLCRD